MRRYKAKIQLSEAMLRLTTGDLGEKIFAYWFKNNFQGEELFKQSADRDYEKIDFADEKGYTYQVKATKGNTYTFNCVSEHVKEHLKADVYVFIRIEKEVAYIEDFYPKEYVEKNITKSFQYGNSFVWAKDLQQQQLELL